MAADSQSGQSNATRSSHSLSRIRAWLQALRLPFYPLSWLGYTLGASLVAPVPMLFQFPAYWSGYAVVFFVEVITVFMNDLHDVDSDRENLNHSAFTGGSRVLVEGLLSPGDLKSGCKVAAILAAATGVVLFFVSSIQLLPGIGLLIMATVLGIGYTMPPLKLSHRGLGELTVAFTHSLLLVQSGAVILGARVGEPEILHVGLPLFFAILPSITLSGLPDCQADKAAGKVTLAVRFGPRVVVWFASISTTTAWLLSAMSGWPQSSLVAMLLHACILVACSVFTGMRQNPNRVDPLMVISLSYVLWFLLVPLIYLPAR